MIFHFHAVAVLQKKLMVQDYTINLTADAKRLDFKNLGHTATHSYESSSMHFISATCSEKIDHPII